MQKRIGKQTVRLSEGVAILSAAGGKISKIVPFIDHGAVVTTPRTEINYVVTEYGIAQLWGRSLKERARALIAIAHPNFRAELAEEYERRFGEALEI